MKWLSALLTFVNLSVVCGLLLGIAGRGLNALSAALALLCGLAFAVAAFLGTRDPLLGENRTMNRREPKSKPRNESKQESTPRTATSSALMRYRRVWFWLMAFCSS